MKYIRTKDGIYKVKDDFIVLKGQELYLPHFQDHIIAQADTIEELCDEFVVVYKNNEPYLTQHLSYTEMEKYNAEINKNGGELYGAIWTDKGLIYVAKMNDKGELELL